MTEFVKGITPTSPEEVPEYLEELGFRLEEAFGSIPDLPDTASSTDLNSATSVVNISPDKQVGYSVFNVTTNTPVWAIGNATSDNWVDATGAVVHTPV